MEAQTVTLPEVLAVQVHDEPLPQASSLEQVQAPETFRYVSPLKEPQVEMVWVLPAFAQKV